MKSRPAILAIDDQPVNLKTLGAALVDDYDFLVALSGEEGLALAAAAMPDLILLDCMMPGMDGFEVCRRLKADPRFKDIPVVFITALSETDVEEAGLELGAADYLLKPINVPIARLRIHNLLERESLRQQLKRHHDELEELVKKRTLSLSIAKEAAEGANRLKATILANISHEFRTPMNGIMGTLALARRRVQDPKVLNYLVKAEQAAESLLGKLTGLLDFAFAESNRLTLERVQFCIADVTAKARGELEAVWQAKGLTVNFHDAQPDSSPAQLIGDPLRIEQILRELIDNAIKFSQQGSITICSSIETDAEGRPWLLLQVRDEGIGIADHDLERIFEPFLQVDGSSTRHYGGNGIGLALCQQLAKYMGGKITVSSALGQGSTFSLRIPTELCPAPLSNRDSAGDAASELRARHAGAAVLVVEGDCAIQAFIKAILEFAGLDVVVAGDGSDAIEMAAERKFELVLMELVMPGVSGLEAARAIRAMPDYRNTPILAATATARAFEEDREACLQAGINAQIPKPITREVLVSAVLQWLDGGKSSGVGTN